MNRFVVAWTAEDILRHLRNEHPGAKVASAEPDFELK